MTATVLVATAGQGILRSNDDGKTWHRLGLAEPIEFDGIVRALAVDPATPSRVYAGADSGLCISDDGGAHWFRPENLLNGQTVWSIAIDPANPAVLYAGTGAPSRAALYKSSDAGATWERTAPEFPEFCSGVNRPRLLTICVDPDDSRNVWYGVEEGGAWRSRVARFARALSESTRGARPHGGCVGDGRSPRKTCPAGCDRWARAERRIGDRLAARRARARLPPAR